MKKTLAIIVAALLVFALAVPAYAATPSKEQKTDPTVTPLDDNGKKVDFIVTDDQGNKIGEFIQGDDGQGHILKVDGNYYQLLVVPYAERGSHSQAIQDALNNAWNELQGKKASDLADVASFLSKVGVKEDELAFSALYYVGLKQVDANCNVISEDVKLSDIGAKSLKVKFTDSNVVLAIAGSNGSWTIVGDGLVEVTACGPVALFKSTTTGNGTTGNNGTSPKTGYETHSGVVISIALCAALALTVGVCYIVDKKKA